MPLFITLLLQLLLSASAFAQDPAEEPARTSLSQSFRVPVAATPDYSTHVSDDAVLEAKLNRYRSLRVQWCAMSPVECFHLVCLEDMTKLKRLQRKAATNADSTNLPLAVFNEVATEFLRRTFPEPLQVIESREGFLYVRPPLMQGYVLSGRKLWEELEIKVAASVADGSFNVTLILDGRYSAGMNPPRSKNDYLDFEVEYPKQFSEFAKKLATRLESYVTASAKTAEAACSTRRNNPYRQRN